DGKYFRERVSIRPSEVRLTRGGTHMKYMLLICDDEKAWAKLSESERQQIYGEYRQFSQEITSSGHYVSGSQLHPTSAATSVRVRDGKRLVTAGPLAEARAP